MSQEPYLASEDSAFLRKALSGRSGHACLEIGAGNGGTLSELAGVFELAVGTDLVRPDMTDWRGARGNFVLADRASCFRDGTFDLVAFNPPYLPSEEVEDVAVDGGRGGTRVPLGFLREALRVVTSGGWIVMLLSSQNRVEELESECARRGFAMRKLAVEDMFFERLYIYEAAARQQDAGRELSG